MRSFEIRQYGSFLNNAKVKNFKEHSAMSTKINKLMSGIAITFNVRTNMFNAFIETISYGGGAYVSFKLNCTIIVQKQWKSHRDFCFQYCSHCSTTGFTTTVVYTILSVGWCI